MKCPHCEVELKIYDRYDIEFGRDEVTECYLGECPECGREFEWEKCYKFYEEKNLVECH